MNRHFSSERFLLGCLLVALIVIIIVLEVRLMSIEERLAENIIIRRANLEDDKTQTNILYNHENRIRRVERTAWAVWDHHAPCDGWPTQQQIARGE